MRTRRGVAFAIAGSMMLSLAGCAGLLDKPSPRSSTVNAEGEPVVVDWVDYPAEAGNDGDLLLAAPGQDRIEAPTRALMGRLRDAIERASGLTMTPLSDESSWFADENWFTHSGNGYGGESMLVTVNCCALSTDDAPDPRQWAAVSAAVSAVTRAAGLGALTPTPLEDTYCNLPDGSCWLWAADVFDGYQWITLSIQDARLDPTGDALREAEAAGRPAASIGVDYGATTVRSGMAAEYAAAIAPFAGLTRPAPTSSD